MSSIKEFLPNSRNLLFQSDLVLKSQRNNIPSKMQAAVQPRGLLDRIKIHTKELEREQLEIKTKINEISALEAESKTLTKRHQLKRKREIDEQIRSIKQHVDDVQSGRRLAAFKTEVQPFVQAWRKTQFAKSSNEPPTIDFNSTIMTPETKILRNIRPTRNKIRHIEAIACLRQFKPPVPG